MKHLFTISLLFPLLLSAQCYGSFEAFAAAGFSNTPSTFSSQSATFRPTDVYRFGFGASFGLGKRVHLRIGVQFSQYGEEASFPGLRWGTQHDGDGGFDPDAPSGEPFFQQRSRHNYIEGLLALRYELSKRRRLRPFLEGGFTLGVYGLTTTEDLTGGTSSSERISTLRSLAPIARFGVGVNYRLNKHLGLFAMPVGQLHLQSINTSGVALTRSWQVALEVGMRVFVDPR
ncbi:MAG: outer membrane beta-barrel protein [Bacteroidota bacterium]